MDWLDLHPHGLTLSLAEGATRDYLVIRGDEVRLHDRALVRNRFTVSADGDLAIREVEIDPDGDIHTVDAGVLDALTKVFRRATPTTFSRPEHVAPHDGAPDPRRAAARRVTEAGMPIVPADVLFEGSLEGVAVPGKVSLDRIVSRFEFASH